MQVGAGSQVLLNNVERFGLYVANSENNISTILSRPNIGMQYLTFALHLCQVLFSGEGVKKEALENNS